MSGRSSLIAAGADGDHLAPLIAVAAGCGALANVLRSALSLLLTTTTRIISHASAALIGRPKELRRCIGLYACSVAETQR